jgi:hypothetical protein
VTATALLSRRCHCREGCLAFVEPGDATVVTPAGVALADHVSTVYPGDTLPLDFTETGR